MAKAIGIDYGDVRVGLALSDPMRIIAKPLLTLQNNDDLIKSANDFSYDDISGNTYKTWHYPDEKPMNGGVEFNDVYASNPMGYNENYMLVENKLNCSTCAI